MMNGKQIMIVSVVAILGFYFMMASIAFANGTFEFSIDEGIEKAINDLSRFSDEPFELTINNYHDDLSSCFYGCETAFNKIANSGNTICIDTFCKHDCVEVCKNTDRSQGVD